MPEHLTIGNFKFGLDGRRSELTSQPGTLAKCENAHINQGGQIEKRKAFALLGQLPNDCFGLQETPTGLTTFGSDAAPVIPAELAGLVQYQRLQHVFESMNWPPITGTIDASQYPPPAHVSPIMDQLVTSCTFGGKAFAVAHFTGGGLDMQPTTQWFYDGLAVLPSVAGVTFAHNLTDGEYKVAYIAAMMFRFFSTYFPSAGAVTLLTRASAATYTMTLPATFTGVGFVGVTSDNHSVVSLSGNILVVQDSGLNSWPIGSTWTITFTLNNIAYTFGFGNVGGETPTFCIAQGQKLYVAGGSFLGFSGIGDSTKWEQQDTGAGFLRVVDVYTSPGAIQSLAPYQGKLAIFSRQNVQIWNINADPAQYSQSQSLQNIGTFAPLSVQALGDLDVLFLSDSGVRSLRVRDSSNNAYVNDLGSPIDSFILKALASAGDNTSACAIVEPTSNRYWLHLKGTIYVLSYFPTLKIVAWSTYIPSYDDGTGNQVLFTPKKFLVYNGQVYCLTVDNKILVYGGVDNNTYDGCVASVELPWLDNKTPFRQKAAVRVNIAMAGNWQVKCSMSPRSKNVRTVVPFTTGQDLTPPDETQDSTFDEGSFTYVDRGSHFKFFAETSPTYKQVATLSGLTLQYNSNEDK